MRGVIVDGKDITIMGYIKEILEFVKKRVKDIPPFKRRVVDLKSILNQEVEVIEHCDCGVIDPKYPDNGKRATVYQSFNGS